jgi:hypothetical protein
MAFSTVPFIFSPNTLIQSAQVNADFASLVSDGNNIDASQITTGVLPVSQGGTGAATAPAALTSLGALPIAGGTITGNLGVMGYITSATTISAPNGTISASGIINSAAGLVTGGSLQTQNDIRIRGSVFLDANPPNTGLNVIYDNSQSAAIQLSTNTNSHTQTTHNFGPRGGVGLYVAFNNSGTYNVSGSWLVLSDGAVKQDIAAYTRGLSDIVALNPVVFRYSPGTPFASDDLPSDLLIGLIADEVRPHIPEIVGETEIKIRGADRTVATLASGTLIFALINAVKELTVRVAQLEAANAAP